MNKTILRMLLCKAKNKKGMLFLTIPFTLILTLFFFGCATFPDTNVNSYRSQYVATVNSYGNYKLQGKTFFIESGDDKVLSTDVEFKEFAGYVSKALELYGAKETIDKKNADICILVTYGIKDESYKESIPQPIWGNTGISSIKTKDNPYGPGTVTEVDHVQGITGYKNIERDVTQFLRVLNIYAYDNKITDKPDMLWKTNVTSSGTSNDLRIILPVMAWTGIGWYGRSTGTKKDFYTFKDDYYFSCWKEGVPQDPNVFSYPKFSSSNINPNKVVVTKVHRKENETIIEFKAYKFVTTRYQGVTIRQGLNSIKVSPVAFIEFGGKKYGVKAADNIVIGEKKYLFDDISFRLYFPAIPSDAQYINISLEGMPKCKWEGIVLKR